MSITTVNIMGTEHRRSKPSGRGQCDSCGLPFDWKLADRLDALVGDFIDFRRKWISRLRILPNDDRPNSANQLPVSRVPQIDEIAIRDDRQEWPAEDISDDLLQ